MLTDELIEAYHATTYQFDGNGKPFTFRANERNVEVENLVTSFNESEWAFVTAWNPYSQVLPDQENHKRHLLMQDILTTFGYQYFEGEGIPDSPGWSPETSFFIVGISYKKAIALGQVFDQNAIVFNSDGDVPKIVTC